MNPLVSILVPAFNAQRSIADTLQSALDQTWARKEIIVVDDGSTDWTVEVARQFASASVSIVSQEHMGAAAARNTALSLSQGDYVQWLDADDLLATDKIAKQIAVLQQSDDPRMLLSCAWGRFLHRPHRATFTPTPLWSDLSPREWLLRKLELNVYMQTAVWLVSRQLTEAAGPWDIRLMSDDDGEYFTRVLLNSSSVKFVHDARVFYRNSGPGSLGHVGQSQEKMEAELRSIELTINHIRSLDDSTRARAACLPYLRNKTGTFYPDRPDIVRRLEGFARELGGLLGPPQVSWKYKWLAAIVGEQMARQIQTFLRTLRWSLVRSWDNVLARLEHFATRSQLPEWDRSSEPRVDLG